MFEGGIIMEDLTYKIVSAIYRSNEFHNIVSDANNYNKLQEIVNNAIQEYDKETKFRKALNTFVKNNF